MNTNVTVGPATIVGYVLSAVAAAGAALAAVEGSLAGPGKWLAILSVITAVATNLGRQLQAVPALSSALTVETQPPVLADNSKLAPQYQAPPGA
jgi:hypothetical protein